MDRLCTDRKQYTNQSKLVGYKVFHIGVLYVESLFSVCYKKFRGGPSHRRRRNGDDMAVNGVFFASMS